MISTDITRTATDSTADRTRATGTSGRAAVCTVMPVAQLGYVAERITAELRVSSFTGGHVWLRPAALDVTVTTAPGRLAWSPPT